MAGLDVVVMVGEVGRGGEGGGGERKERAAEGWLEWHCAGCSVGCI